MSESSLASSRYPFALGAISECFGYYLVGKGLLWNLRRVGTKWEVKNIRVGREDNGGAWRRTTFILRRLVTTLIAYAALDAVTSGPAPKAALLSEQKQSLLSIRELSSEDVVFRSLNVIGFWLGAALVNLLLSNTAAILLVFAGTCDPADFPPLYGSIREAYTIRRFWGVFWHQLLRRVLTSHAEAMTHSVLPIKRFTIIIRYTRLILAFFISALIHYRSDVAMGVPVADSGTLRFFLLQGVFIVLEDGVSILLRDVLVTRRFDRLVGYLWVIFFLVWSTPTWSYPQQRLEVDAADLLPFHFLGLPKPQT
ncbi:hypothetical protein NPX13_g8442 [Xylaria arbuscula]|uniref:Wax synthase domain-containing protein n=1 Tax=Xylaria arbuscula TaxID=114810 RepID=A0A9W8N856_9PEZI|nr:hypothetical protein NPX13_g8442 [Xylaria arbuscula]